MKRLPHLALTVALALACGGCGGGSSNTQAGAIAPAATTSAPSPTRPRSAGEGAEAPADLTPEDAVRALLQARGVDPAKREVALAATLRAYEAATQEIERLALERGQMLDEEEVDAILEKHQHALDAELFGANGADGGAQ